MSKVLSNEIRHAVRSLASRPGFSALVVGVLAAGMACVMFMLAMVDGFVLRPLPFPAPEQLLRAGIAESNGGDDIDDVTGRDLIQIRRQLAGVAEVAGIETSTVNLSDLDRPERFEGATVSANLWHVLGVSPALGRDFAAQDEQVGAPAAILLSHDLWQSRYGSDPSIIGRQLRVNSRPATVIGVMPANVSYPWKQVVWVPGALSEEAKPSDDDGYMLVIRRNAGVNDSAVASALDAWLVDAAHADPQRFRGLKMAVEPLAYYTVNRTTHAVLNIMLVAVFLVLLVACANAANLLLTRTLGRRQEFAVRVALGASRGRIALHLLVQSLVFSCVATIIALPLAQVGVSWLATILRESPSGPPRWLRFDLDGTVVALVIGVAVFTALATGLLPAWRAGKEAVAGTLRDGARGATAGSFARLSKILVVGEIALSCALLISVGTMVRGIEALDHIDIGMDTAPVLTARLGLFTNAYPTGADQLRLYERLTDALRADSQVVEASAATVLPLRVSANRDVLPEGTPFDGNAVPPTGYGAVDDHFLAAYSIQLLKGRFFDARDTANGQRVAVVDSQFAARYAAGGDVVGRRFRLDARTADGPTLTVIGVIAPIKLNSPGDVAQPVMLAPLRQDPARFVSLAVRVRGTPDAFAPRLNAIMHQVDADTPLYWVRDYATVIREATFGERVVAQLFGVFGVIALVLAAAGLYGVMAFSVGQRTREIGVRRALGAPAGQVLRSIFGRAGWQIGIGLAVGVAAGLPLARLLSGALHSITTSDSLAVVTALAVLMAASAVAVIVPARRALRVDPIEALRHE